MLRGAPTLHLTGAGRNAKLHVCAVGSNADDGNVGKDDSAGAVVWLMQACMQVLLSSQIPQIACCMAAQADVVEPVWCSGCDVECVCMLCLYTDHAREINLMHAI